MNAITIGNFTLQVELLTFFITIFAVSFMYKVIMKKSIGDWYFNAIIIYIIIYKGSYIIFQYDLFMKTPLSIVYFDGGWKGQIFAILGLALYMMRITNKKTHMLSIDIVPAYFLFITIYSMIQQAFASHYIAAFIQILILSAYIWIYMKVKLAHENQMFIFFILVQAILLSFFNGLSTTDILMLCLGVALFVLKTLKVEEQ
ncbi:hypothetical protein [Bacillus massiliigorillae]|uniref:hypothetical protein n=1 Tax=Bacillus massiliigorillae TaxID=1243664 RepID=UPI0003A3AB6A|nr:hypothetical protein [Bacillus massiliigorillae]